MLTNNCVIYFIKKKNISWKTRSITVHSFLIYFTFVPHTTTNRIRILSVLIGFYNPHTRVSILMLCHFVKRNGYTYYHFHRGHKISPSDTLGKWIRFNAAYKMLSVCAVSTILKGKILPLQSITNHQIDRFDIYVSSSPTAPMLCMLMKRYYD